MKTIFTTLIISTSFFLTFNIEAQQIFKDSGQRLGNQPSWGVKLGDLDKDGDLDAVIGNWDYRVASKNEIWLNNGNGIFVKSSQELGSSQDIDLFDVNGDGSLDIIGDGIYLNNGSGGFNKSDSYIFRGTSLIFEKNFKTSPVSEAATIEGFGDSAIIRFYTLSNLKAELRDSIIIETSNSTATVNLNSCDLNNDGYADLIVSQYGATLIFFSDQNGGFTISKQKLGNYKNGDIKTADLNKDGFQDIVQTNFGLSPDIHIAGPVKLYMNDKTGKFISVNLPLDSVNKMANQVVLGDFNMDSNLDIFINYGDPGTGNLTTNKCVLLLNDGTASFTKMDINLLPVGYRIDFGDLDNDGDIDAFIALANFYTATSGAPNRVWLNTTIDTTVSINQLKTEEIKVFPNPTTGQLTITFDETPQEKAIVKIYNTEGKCVLQQSFSNKTQQVIDLSCNPAGLYLIKVLSDGIFYDEKILKE